MGSLLVSRTTVAPKKILMAPALSRPGLIPDVKSNAVKSSSLGNAAMAFRFGHVRSLRYAVAANPAGEGAGNPVRGEACAAPEMQQSHDREALCRAACLAGRRPNKLTVAALNVRLLHLNKL